MSTEFENQNAQVEQTEEQGLTFVEPKIVPQVASMWNNTKQFNLSYKLAGFLSQSDIIPQAYIGKVGNCLIAIDIANRMGVSPMVVMQNSQIVRGKFSWTGSACKSMIDGCGKFKRTRYVMVGERGTDSWGYYLQAEARNGEIIDGVTVTLGMAKAEGWWQQNPKWKNMTELMLKYRCASFFMRTECASLAMGFLTAEENEDIEQGNSQTGADLSKRLDEEN